MSVLVSHPTGNENVRAVLRALAGREVLDSFWTALAVPPPVARFGLLGGGLRREAARRCFPEVPWARLAHEPERWPLLASIGLATACSAALWALIIHALLRLV